MTDELEPWVNELGEVFPAGATVTEDTPMYDSADLIFVLHQEGSLFPKGSPLAIRSIHSVDQTLATYLGQMWTFTSWLQAVASEHPSAITSAKTKYVEEITKQIPDSLRSSLTFDQAKTMQQLDEQWPNSSMMAPRIRYYISTIVGASDQGPSTDLRYHGLKALSVKERKGENVVMTSGRGLMSFDQWQQAVTDLLSQFDQEKDNHE